MGRRIGLVVVAQLAAGCPGTAVFLTDPAGTGPVEITAPTNPGTGPGTGAYLVDAEVRATDGTTEATVSLADADGSPLSGVFVAMAGTHLEETDPGRYLGYLVGYDRNYRLRIDGPEGRFVAAARGPEAHALALPPSPWVVDTNVTVSWDPVGADGGAIEADGLGRTEFTGDPGSWTFPAGSLALGPVAVGVERWTVLALTGAAPRSTFLVSIAADGAAEVAGEAAEPGGIGGELRVDSEWQDAVRTAWVVAWPGAYAGRFPPAAYVRIDGFQDRENYDLGGLDAGTWTVLAYLDLDASDGDSAEPSGPTDGDPYAQTTTTIDAGQTRDLELRMESVW